MRAKCVVCLNLILKCAWCESPIGRRVTVSNTNTRQNKTLLRIKVRLSDASLVWQKNTKTRLITKLCEPVKICCYLTLSSRITDIDSMRSFVGRHHLNQNSQNNYPINLFSLFIKCRSHHIERYILKKIRVSYRAIFLVIGLQLFSWVQSWYKWQQFSTI